MPISRRQFALLAQSAIVASSLKFKANAATGLGTDEAAADLFFTRNTFLPLVNTGFEISTGPVRQGFMTLMSVGETGKTMPAGSGTQRLTRGSVAQLRTFNLEFVGTGDALPQATYQFTHPTTGMFPLFIVPSGKYQYTATICRLDMASYLAQHPPIRQK